MKILALIPARAGSKRMPGKNIRLLGSKPLITWSINVAKNHPKICDILVTTDSQEIADLCKQEGAYVPWLRPDSLATDTSSSVDAALHALNWYEEKKGKVEGVLLLQPTSPFRTRETIERGINLFYENNYQSVLGVSPALSHPMWTLKMEGKYLIPFLNENGFKTRSQDLPQAYVVNGSFYLISPEELRNFRSFIVPKAIPLIINSSEESLDIDSQDDWEKAKLILKSLSDV